MTPFFRITGLIAAALCSGLFSCSAQDAQNPVPVSKEPRHHNVFENAWVRVLDVHISPGDTSLFHKHETPSVFIVLSNVKTGSEVIIEEKKTNAPVTFGNIWFEGFYTQSRIHRVWNEDTTEFHVMDVELVNRVNKPATEIGSRIRDTGFQLLFDQIPVRGYLLNLQPRTHFPLKKRQTPVLAVLLNDPAGDNPTNDIRQKNISDVSGTPDSGKTMIINGKPLRKKGDYIFIPANEKIDFFNKGGSAGKLAFFELK